MSAVLQRVLDAGLYINLIEGGKLLVTPASRITPELRAFIRSHKEALVRWFAAANDAQEAAPPTDPSAWRELAQAYHLHHFACSTCQAAGRGYSARCGVGAALWGRYQRSIA